MTMAKQDERRFLSRFSSTASQLCLSVLALSLFAVVIIFVRETYAMEHKSNLELPFGSIINTDASTTIAVVRIAQGVLATLTDITIKEAFVSLHWILINTSSGLPYLSLLALSPTTGELGLSYLLFAKRSNIATKLRVLLR